MEIAYEAIERVPKRRRCLLAVVETINQPFLRQQRQCQELMIYSRHHGIAVYGLKETRGLACMLPRCLGEMKKTPMCFAGVHNPDRVAQSRFVVRHEADRLKLTNVRLNEAQDRQIRNFRTA